MPDPTDTPQSSHQAADSPPGAEKQSGQQQQLEGGAYEIIRARMETHGGELRQRLQLLNEDRKAIFGAIEPSLVGTERVTTRNNCVPRDMIPIGNNRFVFGYNVQMGLKSTTEVGDVFAVYDYDSSNHTFHENADNILDSGDFVDDFKYLYKYYRQTVFVKFMVIGPNLYMAMRIGKNITDIKTFKWLRSDDGTIQYLGNRFDHEYVFPERQEFQWVRAHRDMHRAGAHPHVSIEDRIFVETVGGDLTIKIEDNTATGEGIYSEDVTNQDQTLDDAEVFYAIVGDLIVLKVLPYQEKDYRFLVYNEKVKRVNRIDTIADSCVLLPEEHGLIFSNGYLLQTGEVKIFESGVTNMRFERRIPSSNGEDHLYVFYNRESGEYVLLSYNIIEQRVDTPILCNGYSLFTNGELVYFRTEDQPQKHHVLQVWQTPYVGEDATTATSTDSYLYKVGNADIVRCMAECREVLTLLSKEDTYAGLYIDLFKKTGDIADSYYWIGKSEARALNEPLHEINGAAKAAIEEFDKVQRLRRSTKAETNRVKEKAMKLVAAATHTAPDDILGFVHHLAELRTVRGEIISLRDLRYVNTDLIDTLESQVEDANGSVSNQCVTFLLQAEALNPYRKQVDDQKVAIPKIKKVTEANEIEEALSKAGDELEMLIDIVGNLKIEDTTQTTQIIDDISSIYSTLNQVRVELKNKKKDLARVEGVAQFGAQLKLLNQAVVNYLDLCDTPEKCEEFLTKTMIQLEELEGKFSEFDEYVEQLTEKREELYSAFDSRKQGLIEARNKRANTLVKSAERILNGIKHRVERLETINEINGYLASDLMIDKTRDIIAQLTELGDSVKADDIQTQLKTVREDAVRQLKDRQELFVDGKNIIQFGKHKFSVNTQELDLSIVPREDKMFFHLGGTDFFEEITDPEFLATRTVWDQTIVSENTRVWRAEYLAFQILKSVDCGEFETEYEDEKAAMQAVREFMGPRYAEGYTKGVHDHDTVKILRALVPIHESVGLLRFSPTTRALALLFWQAWSDENAKSLLHARLRAFGKMQSAFGTESTAATYVAELRGGITAFVDQHADAIPLLADANTPDAAEYLFHELIDEKGTIVSPRAAELAKSFHAALTGKRTKKVFEEALATVEGNELARFQIIADWLGGFVQSHEESQVHEEYLVEAAAHHLRGGFHSTDVAHVNLTAEVTNVLDSHSVVEKKTYHLHYNHFRDKLLAFENEDVPKFERFHDMKGKLVEAKRAEMRLDEFKPRVMTSFVRNRLLDQVYLPMIGANLAKQMGTVGDDTRTDRMGMLLLISPPGYGKTTLMEYVANRLGVTFVKINGPAIGHDVTSLDPQDAPNASAREEIEKLNLSFEMGDNVMIYLDDIQHCNPEFLQKFISLCDAQRKIEGVHNGVARTYDLRGKKIAVIMAGNPYTESGGKFQIPDMLANRADTYNLGDIVGGHAESFKASYIENSLTSNPVLAKLASRSQKDVYEVMKIAASSENTPAPGDDFEGNYSIEEINEFVNVTRKLLRIRDTILQVNLEYIKSAAQQDDYRTEPPFKLQGSYRNMNRIAEKVVPLMTGQEIEALIDDHYQNESQTLTTGAEANLLKFKELENKLGEESRARWTEIKKTFGRNLLMGGGENDPVSRVVGSMTTFAKGLDEIRDTIESTSREYARPQSLTDQTITQLEKIIKGLRSVPVEVDINVLPVQEGSDPRPAPKPAAKKKASKKAAAAKKLPVDIETDVRQDP